MELVPENEVTLTEADELKRVIPICICGSKKFKLYPYLNDDRWLCIKCYKSYDKEAWEALQWK